MQVRNLIKKKLPFRYDLSKKFRIDAIGYCMLPYRKKSDFSMRINCDKIYSKKYFGTTQNLDFFENYHTILNILKEQDITLEEFAKNFIKLKSDKTKSRVFVEMYENKYAKALNQIKKISKKDFIDNFFFHPSLDLKTYDNLEHLTAIYMLISENISPNSINIEFCFNILAYGIFKSHKEVSDYSEIPKENLLEILKAPEKLEPTIGQELLYLKKSLIHFFDLISSSYDPIVIETCKFLASAFESKNYSHDLLFITDLTKRLSEPRSGQTIPKVSDLKPSETPFENLIPKTVRLGYGKTFQTDSKQLCVNICLEKALLFFIENRIENMEELNSLLKILINSNVKQDNLDVSQIINSLLQKNKYNGKEDILELSKNLCSLFDTNSSFELELLRKMFVPIFKSLVDFEFDKVESLEIYKIFRLTQSFNLELLGKVEKNVELIWKDSSSFNLLAVFYFYASVPKKFSKRIDQKVLLYHIKRYKYDFDTLTDIALASIFMGYERTVSNIQDLPVLDSVIWHDIFESFMSIKIETLNTIQKLKLYRSLKILSIVLSQNVFNKNLIDSRLTLLSKDLEKINNPLESEFQKEVEMYIPKVNKKFKKEVLIDGLFSVDFLIGKHKVIEVNGPHHYHLISGESGENYFETNSSFIKCELLRQLNYKVGSIPFFKWIEASEEEKINMISRALNWIVS